MSVLHIFYPDLAWPWRSNRDNCCSWNFQKDVSNPTKYGTYSGALQVQHESEPPTPTQLLGQPSRWLSLWPLQPRNSIFLPQRRYGEDRNILHNPQHDTKNSRRWHVRFGHCQYPITTLRSQRIGMVQTPVFSLLSLYSYASVWS